MALRPFEVEKRFSPVVRVGLARRETLSDCFRAKLTPTSIDRDRNLIWY